MKEKFYKISEGELIDLLAAWHELQALRSGGVDNWEWAGDSCMDSLRDYAEDYHLSQEEAEDLDFEGVARLELSDYVEVE